MAKLGTGAALPRPDLERAEFVFQKLARAWRERESGGYFGGLVAPQQRYMPEVIKKNPDRVAQFLTFSAILMRGSVDSDHMFAFVEKFYRLYPHFFDPRVLARTKPDVLESVLRETARLSYPRASYERLKGIGPLGYKADEFIQHLIAMARGICDQWEGDARNIFYGVSNFDEAVKRVKFQGIGEKILALWMLWFWEFGLIPKDVSLPGVADFHFLRILLANRIWQPELKPLREVVRAAGQKRFLPHLLETPGVRVLDSTRNRLMRWTDEFLRDLGLDSYDVSHGTWYLSREFCSLYPGNRASSTGRKKRNEIVITGFADLIGLERGEGWPDRPDYCGTCPLSSTCELSVPNAPYYRNGVMAVVGKRIHSPFTELPVMREVPRDFKERSSAWSPAR
ncbi:MAG: hypothetical protein HYT39_03585 [Candidatus Sungbacteria bacterium]|nr:hypothetical protein [Candidatus Sungbacteria bacterium]